jgi:hypothetical protein
VKVLSKKHVPLATIEHAIGVVWCSMKGIDCKDLTKKTSLVTFHQVSEKRWVMEDDLWIVGKDLRDLVVVSCGRNSRMIEFTTIPILIRVLKLPFEMIRHIQMSGRVGSGRGSFDTTHT